MCYNASMDENLTAPEQLKPYLFQPGQSGNPAGRPVEDKETKLIRKAAKEIIKEYKEALAEALPLIQPVLIAKAIEGDMTAIKELHDRAMDKAKMPTDITTNGKDIVINVVDYNKINGDNNSI